MSSAGELGTWHSYPKVYALGHPAVREIFAGEVTVEEKVDGSQFSFGLIDGELRIRSKGKQMVADEPESLFVEAAATVRALRDADKLVPGWTYRGEVMKKPKHNCLAYGRVPKGNIILFDVTTAPHEYLPPMARGAHIDTLELERVPVLFQGHVTDPDMLRGLIVESCLGGPLAEGVVVKNYARFTRDGHVMMGKWVRPDFREAQAVDWRTANPTRGDVVERLVTAFRTDARWLKAIQHLRDDGKLEQSPRDIGPLIREIKADVKTEAEAIIRDALFDHFWPQIERRLIQGFPEWYKAQLLEGAFGAVGAP